MEELTTRGRIDIARKIETARELGDLSENGDYHAAKEEQAKIEQTKAQISEGLQKMKAKVATDRKQLLEAEAAKRLEASGRARRKPRREKTMITVIRDLL